MAAQLGILQLEVEKSKNTQMCGCVRTAELWIFPSILLTVFFKLLFNFNLQ